MGTPWKLTPLTVRELKPQGWLRRQLEIQAQGLGGHLDEIWPDIRDSRWIGGDREGWERVPYWLDGFIPLAWLLDDADMKARAKRYIDAILERQQEDGWICPCTQEERDTYDLWALLLIGKVLTVYADCSGDTRIVPALTRALKQLDGFLDGHTLHHWGAARWFEGLIPILWLYDRTGEEWLPQLAHRLEIQGFSYDRLFADFTCKEPQRRWSFDTHVVNLAMCLKQGALRSRLQLEDPDTFASQALDTLLRFHSMAAGHFTGDECLSGDSPVQGTELCGVVEAMYSYETLLSAGGNAMWGDRLERLAFNALPATFRPDMWSHQYLQMTNQVECSRLPEEHVVFRTNGPEAHLFGLEPNFGCCTANFHQGWPKLALSAFMRSATGLVSAVLLPSRAEVRIGDAQVCCTLETAYPFRDHLTYTITTDRPVTFPLAIRIPAFAQGARVDGEAAKTGAFHEITRCWEGETRVEVDLEFACVLTPRPNDLYCLWRGPLLYALPLKERWVRHEYTRDGVERTFPYCDYEAFAESPWNYGFAGTAFTPREQPLTDCPFSSDTPPVTIDAMLAPVNWEKEYGVCTPEPAGRAALAAPEVKQLIPYGCTCLRMTELPLVQNRNDTGVLAH